MSSTRDWRESFSHLELVREREQVDRAGDEGEAAFGTLASPPGEAELILAAPAAEPAPPKRRKPAAKPASPGRKPAAGKKAKRKKAVRKPAARKTTRTATTPKATTAKRRTTAAAKPVAEEQSLAAVIPLPVARAAIAEAVALQPVDEAPPWTTERQMSVPETLADLTVPETFAILPPPVSFAPLPRQASLAPYRKGGLIEAIGFWLRNTTRRAKAKMGASAVLARPLEPASAVGEIEHLRAENERLRRELEALLTLSDASQFKFQA